MKLQGQLILPQEEGPQDFEFQTENDAITHSLRQLFLCLGQVCVEGPASEASLGSDGVTLKGRGSGYLGQVGLDLALGVGCLSNAVGEGDVHLVELVPHLVGRHHQQVFDAVPQLGGGCPFALGAEDVVIRELGPRLWHRDPGGGKGEAPSKPLLLKLDLGTRGPCQGAAWIKHSLKGSYGLNVTT